MTVTELIPGKLYWAGQTATYDEISCRRIRLTDIEAEDFDRGTYKVSHYSRRQCGGAFGPLSLGQTMRFCQVLGHKLNKFGKILVERGYGLESHANTSVMVGAYLMLLWNWSLHDVRKALRDEAQLKFNCSWIPLDKKVSPIMTVDDCWQGLELALKLGWVQPLSRYDDTALDLAISQYNRLLHAYDAAWLVPSQVLVMADPMTSIMDPRMSTCSSISNGGCQIDTVKTPESSVSNRSTRPPEKEENANLSQVHSEEQGGEELNNPTSSRQSLRSMRTMGSIQVTIASEAGEGSLEEDEEESATSVHSVCKGYSTDENPEDLVGPPPDMVTFLKLHNVRLIVRMNDSAEPGLEEIGGSYCPTEFKRNNIRHRDFFIKDVAGALPGRRMISEFLSVVESLGLTPLSKRQQFGELGNQEDANSAVDAPVGKREPALAIHCKSGFGRSAVMCCLAMIHVYDVPGRALLGWVRIARPGAFTVPEQECFLCGLRGREDLHRVARLEMPELPPNQVDEAHPKGCCSVQ